MISRIPVDSSVLGCTVILDPDFVTPRTLFAAPLCKLLLHYRHCLSCLHRLCCATLTHHSALTRAEHTLHNQISSHQSPPYQYLRVLSITRYIININHLSSAYTHPSSPIMTISSLSTYMMFYKDIYYICIHQPSNHYSTHLISLTRKRMNMTP